MPLQQRSQTPHHSMDASLALLENALLERARAIAAGVLHTPDLPGNANDIHSMRVGINMMVRSIIAEEFQKLAKELHHW